MDRDIIDEVFGTDEPVDRGVRRRKPPRPVSRVGGRVKLLMVARGWDQTDLAAALGITSQAVSGMLRSYGLRETTVERLASVLGCKLSDIDPRYDDKEEADGAEGC